MRGLFEGAVYSRARSIRGRGRIVRARSTNFTVCVMRGLFEGVVYSRARSIRGRGRIVRARSINFTVCVMRGLFGGRELFEEIRYVK